MPVRLVYEKVTEKRVQERIRNRHRENILKLESLGFEEYACVVESIPLFDNWRVPLTWLSGWLMGGLLFYRGDSRFGLGYITLYNPATKAYVSSGTMGLTFETPFEDGTLLVTVNAGEFIVSDPQILQRHYAADLFTLHNLHVDAQRKMEWEGFKPLGLIPFETFEANGKRHTAALVPAFESRKRKEKA